MLLQIFVIFSIFCSNAIATKNFWGNDICNSDSDCSGLTSCDPTFGCSISPLKVGLVMFAVFLSVVLIIIAVVFCCYRATFRNRYFMRPNTRYMHPNTVIVPNPSQPGWNQHQMGPTTAYPYPPSQNPMYTASSNPTLWNQNQMGQTTVNPSYQPGTINAFPAPTAPMEFGYEKIPPT